MMLIRLIVAVWVAVFLNGCVTETEGGPAMAFDEAKAMNAYINAANEYLKVKDPENALRHLRKAEALDSSDARVHLGMAYSLELMGDDALAEQHFVSAIKRTSDVRSRARNNYASFLYKQERFAEAKTLLEKVTEDVKYPRRAAAFSTLGLVNLKLGETEDAEMAFMRSINLERRNVVAALELANLLADKQQYQAAEQYYAIYKYLGRTSARGLLVGIKLAIAKGDDNMAASNALALKNMFPASIEYAEYLRLYQK